jgi:hypothetical protein
MYHPHRMIEVDEGGAAALNPDRPGYRVSSVSVAPGFFEAFDAPILAGRGFHAGDAASETPVVIVNQSFVDNVLGGRNPIGRHIRHISYEERKKPLSPEPSPEPWYEIVGVVKDLGLALGGDDPKIAGFYHPVAAGGTYPGHLAVRVKGDPASFAPRLRSIATRLEPDLRLYGIQPLDEMNTAELKFISFWFWLISAVSGIAVFLSLAGIYAVMSFTVAQRTREIGIRVALGGTAQRVAGAIFRRPLAQIGLGIVLGAVLSGFLVAAAEGTTFTLGSAGLLAGYAAGMAGVCILACIMPTRRALGVEPTEALRTLR